MKNLTQIIQGYLGMTPKDKGCSNWTEMESKMEEEINEFISQNKYGLPTKKCCFFKLKDKKYVAENGVEIPTDMLVKHPHQITDIWSYIIID